jgi:hypothetical protein
MGRYVMKQVHHKETIMKRTQLAIAACAVIMLAVVLIGCQTTGQVYTFDGTDVLYVSKVGETLIESDLIIVAFLEERGLLVTPIDGRMLTPEIASDYDVVYISEVISSSTVGSKLNESPVPVVSAEHYIADDMGFAGPNEQEHYGKLEFSYTDITIVDPGHPLAAGLSGDVTIYTDVGSVGFSVPQGDVEVVAVVPDIPEYAVIYGYDTGAVAMDGSIVPARRAFYYLFEGMETLQTEAGWNLLGAAFAWALGIEE